MYDIVDFRNTEYSNYLMSTPFPKEKHLRSFIEFGKRELMGMALIVL